MKIVGLKPQPLTRKKKHSFQSYERSSNVVFLVRSGKRGDKVRKRLPWLRPLNSNINWSGNLKYPSLRVFILWKMACNAQVHLASSLSVVKVYTFIQSWKSIWRAEMRIWSPFNPPYPWTTIYLFLFILFKCSVSFNLRWAQLSISLVFPLLSSRSFNLKRGSKWSTCLFT